MAANRRSCVVLSRTVVLALVIAGCGDDGPGSDAGETGGSEDTTGDGDGDPATGDGDGDPTTRGDGDGDPTTSGDGDGDPTTSGDGDGDPTTSGDGDGDPMPDAQDYAELGPHGVSTSTDSLAVTPDCDLSYGIYEPDELASDVPVLLAHGFMRSIADMAETANHIASWGVRVYTVPLCTNSFAINHAQNGEAMAALGEALAPEGAVYSGFSAGGLAAMVAAAGASNTVAYVGLDAVDNNGLGLDAAAQLDAPARGSIAEPGQCNNNNDFIGVYDAIPGAPVIRIIGAEHFDFEIDACPPGDLACSFCAPAGPQTRALALGMTTAAILIETGADLGGYGWWQPGGEYFDMFVAEDQIMLMP